MTSLKLYDKKDVTVMRIGDKMSDKLVVPKEFQDKILKIEKYCTKPELEILLIIGENLYSEFEKEKSKISPKAFAKKHIRYNKNRYSGSSKFYSLYFEDRPDFLVQIIKEYKRRAGNHKKDEMYLADILK